MLVNKQYINRREKPKYSKLSDAMRIPSFDQWDPSKNQILDNSQHLIDLEIDEYDVNQNFKGSQNDPLVNH